MNAAAERHDNSGLPPGWAEASLRELAGPTGVVTDGDWVESKDQDPEGGVRLTQLADIGDGQFLDRSDRFMNAATAERLRCTFLKEGDLLIARMPDPLGRACIFPGVGRPAVTAVDVFVWRPDELGADACWLMYFINSPEVRREIQGEAGGTTRQRIAGRKLKELVLAVPPVLEQLRIAAKLDQLTARTARAKVDLDRVSSLIAKCKQAILTSAFRGDLTRHWRGEPMSTPFDHPTEKQWPIPAEWKWKRVGEIGTVSLGRQRSPKDHVGPLMRPYVRAANITWKGWDLSDVKQMNFDEQEFPRFALKQGDVLVNEGSGSAKEVGKPAIWRGQIPNCCFQNTLIRVQPPDSSSEFLYWYFMYAALTRGFISSTQGVNIYHIGKEGLARFPIPMPPQAEQNEIVQSIEVAFAWLDKVTTEHARAARLLSKLDGTILAQAYRGELAPQNPDDEPAAVFLDRIRTELATRPKSKRDRSRTTQPKRPTMPKSRANTDVKGKPYLLRKVRELGGKTSVEGLYGAADLPLVDFYKQLSEEYDQGWVRKAGDMVEAA